MESTVLKSQSGLRCDPRSALRGKNKARQSFGIPNMLSFLTSHKYRQWRADVTGLSDFSQTEMPDQIPLLDTAIT